MYGRRGVKNTITALFYVMAIIVSITAALIAIAVILSVKAHETPPAPPVTVERDTERYYTEVNDPDFDGYVYFDHHAYLSGEVCPFCGEYIE